MSLDHWMALALTIGLGLVLIVNLAVAVLIVAIMMRVRKTAQAVSRQLEHLDGTLAGLFSKAWPALVPTILIPIIKKYLKK